MQAGDTAALTLDTAAVTIGDPNGSLARAPPVNECERRHAEVFASWRLAKK